jgi:hypothetical protein
MLGAVTPSAAWPCFSPVGRPTRRRLLAAVLVLAALPAACAPIPTPSPTTPPATPDEARISVAIAAAEAKLRIRASQPTDLPPGARISRVATVNESPPTLDIEYLVGERRFLLRQRPAQSDPQFPPDARPVDGEAGMRAVRRVDGAGNEVGADLYWTKDGMDYALSGALPLLDMLRIARGVSRPTAA